MSFSIVIQYKIYQCILLSSFFLNIATIILLFYCNIIQIISNIWFEFYKNLLNYLYFAAILILDASSLLNYNTSLWYFSKFEST